MPVVGMLVDLSIGPRVGVDRVRPNEVSARDHVPEMAVDGVDEEELAYAFQSCPQGLVVP